MKRGRYTPEQIVRKLRERERLLVEGQTIAEAAKQVEISEQAYHRTRVTLPAAATVVALLATAAMLLAGCNRTDPEPAATTPTAEAPRSPQASGNDRAPASQGTAGPTPPATASAAPSPTAGREARSSASATEASTAPPESPRQEGSPTPTAAPAPPAPLPARDADRGADAAGVNTRDPTPAGSGAASRGWPPAPTPQPGQVGAVAPSPTESGASARSTGGSVLHTWQDGEHTRRVYLQTNLVIQNTADNTAEDVVVRAGSRENIVQRTGRHAERDTLPVFRTESGSMMTLPGGVLLVLAEQWDQRRINTFFATNSIAKGSIEAMDFAPNAFFIDTAPGLPSLELANALAAEDGVVISSPNWRRQVVLR